MELVGLVLKLAISLVIMHSCSAAEHYTETPLGYGKNVLMELCQFVGVKYIRNPDNPECSYIACWDRTPYNMPCPPGLVVHPLFFWGGNYPCTENDANNRCTYIKDFMMGRASPAPSAQLYSKQGPRDGISEVFVSRDKTSSHLRESVHGSENVHKSDSSAQNSRHNPTGSGLSSNRAYHTKPRTYLTYVGYKPKSAVGKTGLLHPLTESVPKGHQAHGSGVSSDINRSVSVTYNNNNVSNNPRKIDLLNTIVLTTESKPENTLKLADSASVTNYTTTSRAPTAKTRSAEQEN